MEDAVDEFRGIWPTMLCKRCGTEIAQTTRICPVCGTSVENASMHTQSQKPYGVYASSSHKQAAQPTREYATPPPGSVNNGSPSSPNGYNSAVPPYQNAQAYQQEAYKTYVPETNSFLVTNKNDTALVTEILLSLIGIFGVGWIMAGKTVSGIIILTCSILIYWPIMILGTFFTLGIGLICLGPIAIVTIILNFVLLNSYLNRRATRFVITQQPPTRMTVPPQQP